MDVPSILLLSSAFLFIITHLASALRCPDLSVRFGRVKYRSRGRVAIFGCWTGFLLYGEKYAGCFRGAWDVTPPKCVRKGCADVSFKFGTIRKPMTSTNAVLSFRCYQGYDLVGPREIFCDGSSYDTLPPVCKKSETDISCDFENNNLCKWRSDQTQNLTFQLTNTSPPSRILKTGPEHDHTLGPESNGYYIYLETSSTIQGEVARITTPYLPHADDTNTCFKFWYHMFGLTIGTLRVYINDTVMFERQGDRGDRWRLGKAKLPSDSHFKIVVEAVTGRGYLGDIALDDFDVGQCTDSRGNTCADRCSDDESDLFAACNCHPGCVDESSCCSDFETYCVAETTTEFVEETVEPSELSTALEETTSDTTIFVFDDELEDTYRTDAYTVETDDKTETERFDYDSKTEIFEIEGSVDEITTEYFTGDVDEITFENEQNTSYISFQNVSETNIPPNLATIIQATSITTHRYNLRPRTTLSSFSVTKLNSDIAATEYLSTIPQVTTSSITLNRFTTTTRAPIMYTTTNAANPTIRTTTASPIRPFTTTTQMHIPFTPTTTQKYSTSNPTTTQEYISPTTTQKYTTINPTTTQKYTTFTPTTTQKYTTITPTTTQKYTTTTTQKYTTTTTTQKYTPTTTQKYTTVTPTTTQKYTTITPTTTQKYTTITPTTTQKYTTITPTTTQKYTTITPTTALKSITITPTATQNPITTTSTSTRKSTTTRPSVTTKTIPNITSNPAREFTPIDHHPVTVSTKDPKITTRSLPKSTTVNKLIVIKSDQSNDTLTIAPTETLTYLQANDVVETKKWVSTYKKKGAFKLVDEQQPSENTSVAGITTAIAACIVVIIGTALAVILFLRKRRLSSGPSDGAEIVFIPADELLDFTPASGPNRDSGVYSDTVMSLKRDKGSKSYKMNP